MPQKRACTAFLLVMLLCSPAIAGSPLDQFFCPGDIVLKGLWNEDKNKDIIIVYREGARVRVLDGSDLHQIVVYWSTGLNPSTGTFRFTLGDWDRDGIQDLVCIKIAKCSTNKMEVHILSGVSGYKTFIFHGITGWYHHEFHWQFAMCDWDRDGIPDLACVDPHPGKGGTGVHILGGASGFKNWVLQVVTGLDMGDGDYNFWMEDYNRAGKPDLGFTIYDGTGKTFRRCFLSGESNYRVYCCDETWDLEKLGYTK